MKILVVSNFYPPHYVGGYELGCRDVVDGLRRRGHQVEVLTSTYGVDNACEGDGVYRWLETDAAVKGRDPAVDLPWLVKKELRNRRAFRRLCRALRPDLIYLWNLRHISVSLAQAAEQAGCPVAYFVSDHWLSEWEKDAWYSQRHRLPGRFHRRLLWRGLRGLGKITGLLSSRPLELKHVQFASHYLKRAALRAARPVADAEVIHWGIDADSFSDAGAEKDRLRLLYVGQLIANKGVQTAVEALKILSRQDHLGDLTLTIAGGPDYGGRVQHLVDSLGLDGHVRLTGLVPRERLPEIYRDHGVLIFPSVWDEPFSITLLEAMASGLAVVGTQTGGSPEILEEEVNALVFEKEDAQACAENIRRLVEDAQLFHRLRHKARDTVAHSYTLGHMIDQIERSLRQAAEKCGESPRGNRR